jgi:long-chain acyl-CoA synthetase
MTTTATLPMLLTRNAQAMPARPAIREKRRGIWQTYTWRQYDARVQAFARGLAALGFRRADRLAVLGDNRPKLYWAMLAAQALGGVGVPLWPDADASWLAQVLRAAAVSVVVAEDHDQVEKLLSIRNELPDLRLIVCCDPADESPPLLRSFDTIEAGAIEAAGNSHDVDVAAKAGAAKTGAAKTGAAEIGAGQPSDPALLLHTTIGDGRPRGVLLSHANLTGAADALIAAGDFRQTDDCLSFLPMAWIGDALYSLTVGLLVGFTCNCPEDPETARRDLRELGPAFLLAPPRVWESLLAEIDAKSAQATPLKRRLFNTFRPTFPPGADDGPVPRTRRLLGETLIHAPMRDQLGLSRTRWAHVGGGTLAPDLLRLWRGFGVDLKQTYGPPELSGIVALSSEKCVSTGAIGPACPEIDTRISPDGEVEVRSPGICVGYDRDEAATRAATTADGWWRTGDSGRIDALGNLTITGRMSDLARLDDGTSFAPEEIELALRGSRIFSDVVVPAQNCPAQDCPAQNYPFVAAIIVIDAAAAGDWARSHGIAYTTTAELISLPALRQLSRDEVNARNSVLPPPLWVRRFALLDGGVAAGTEAGLSRERQRRVLLDANGALVRALFLPGEMIGPWTIEDTDGEIPAAREPADA